ncbi:hypothetical protein B0H11DRAFT_1909195 [Mycena galericulata]|nr:hypothetical protein B0H11DRAFT_1909195 [Mycena galericulata]
MASVQDVKEGMGIWLFSAVALVVVVYDHALSIEKERRTIWANSNAVWHSKFSFFINRYTTEAVILYAVYVVSGTSSTLDTPACQRFIWIFGSISIVFGAISHFLRIYVLWDRRQKVAQILTASFISSFDLFIVILAVWNAMERPHLTNIEVVSALQGDGIKFFVAIFGSENFLHCPSRSHELSLALRFANMVFSIFRSQSGECFIAVTIVWAFCSVINSQLHMRLEDLALPRNRGPVIMFDDTA